MIILGLGRTGTFMALCMAHNRIKFGRSLDVKDVVAELRKQRDGCVQNKSQYLYIYSVLLRWIFRENT